MHTFMHTPGTLIAQTVSFPDYPSVLLELLIIPKQFLALEFSGAAITASFTSLSTGV